jgi:hypothetical protein
MSSARNYINNISAFKTKLFGPKYWYTLFTMVLGAYPVKIDSLNKEHLVVKKYFKSMLYGLRYTLPCSICRNSYASFYEQLNINKFLSSRYRLTYWLYLMKDKVNRKLLTQEREIKKSHTKVLFKTKPTPSFLAVVKHYYKERAMSCNSVYKRCM